MSRSGRSFAFLGTPRESSRVSHVPKTKVAYGYYRDELTPTPSPPPNTSLADESTTSQKVIRRETIEGVTPKRQPVEDTTTKKRPMKETKPKHEDLKEIPSKTKWSTQKKVIVGLIIGALVILIIVAIVLAIVVTRSTTSSETTSTTTTASCFAVAWSFDSVTNDTYGIYNGQLVNSATYSVSSSTIPYLGQGQALSLSSASNSSFQVTSPFLNLSYTSFTIEAWVFSSSYAGDNGIIGQCQCSSCSNQCFYFIIRASKLYAGFTLNDVSGITTLTASTWYHVTFVYNYDTQQQILYLNGVQDNIKSNSAAYRGTSGIISIGSTQLFSTTNFFNGYIDNLKIVTRAKSATEVLNSGSLIAYFSFDLPSPTTGNGPNTLTGTSVNTATVTGRVNQGMRFTGSSSYFQAYGFYQAGFGVNYNKPFSISLWINPSATVSCSFIQMSVSQSSGSCTNILGIWTYTGNTAQIIAQGYAWPTIYGPFITLNTWMHVSWTFSLAKGYILYINGAYYGTTGYYSYTGTSGVINWVQVGYNFACSSAYMTNAAYQGIIDELYIHNRELSASEVLALASV